MAEIDQDHRPDRVILLQAVLEPTQHVDAGVQEIRVPRVVGAVDQFGAFGVDGGGIALLFPAGRVGGCGNVGACGSGFRLRFLNRRTVERGEDLVRLGPYGCGGGHGMPRGCPLGGGADPQSPCG